MTPAIRPPACSACSFSSLAAVSSSPASIASTSGRCCREISSRDRTTCSSSRKQAAQGRHVPHEHLVDPGVPAQLAEPLVEREVGAAGGDRVAGIDGPVDLVGQRPQSRQDGRVLGPRDHAPGPALERGPQTVDLSDVVRREAHDERASAGLLLQEALGPEQLERLAHRPTADVELLGDLRLDEVLALLEPAVEDLFPDAIGGVLGEGTRRLKRPEGGRWLAHAAERSTAMSTVDHRQRGQDRDPRWA